MFPPHILPPFSIHFTSFYIHIFFLLSHIFHRPSHLLLICPSVFSWCNPSLYLDLPSPLPPIFKLPLFFLVFFWSFLFLTTSFDLFPPSLFTSSASFPFYFYFVSTSWYSLLSSLSTLSSSTFFRRYLTFIIISYSAFSSFIFSPFPF